MSQAATYQDTVRGYVDLHAHVLPGIDDGPADADGALAMLRAAAAAGIGTIAVTPHLRSDFPDVRVTELAPRAQQLREAGEMAGIDIRIISGAEVSLVWALEASDEQLALATYDQRGTDLLIETPTFNVIGLESLLYRLRAKGLRVTLAHPERSVDFQRDPARLVELVRQGVLLQVNAETLLKGRRRSDAQRLGRYLCARGPGPRLGVGRAPRERLATGYLPRGRSGGGGDPHRPRPCAMDDADRAGGDHRRSRPARRPGSPIRAGDAQAPTTTVRKGQVQTRLAASFCSSSSKVERQCQCRRVTLRPARPACGVAVTATPIREQMLCDHCE